MAKKIDLNSAKCTGLSFDSAVEFKAAEGKELTGFVILAYTGAAVDRWWGKLVVDIQGITAKAKMPVFRDHDHGKIVGHTSSFSKDKDFAVTGGFSKKTEHAKEVVDLAAEGFPWQASIGVRPKVITEVKEGASLEVNGKTIKGPAEVWSKSEVYEVSFVPLGADSNTRVTVFSEQEQDGVMEPKNNNEEVSMNLETLKKEHPDLVAAITKEATDGLDARLEEARKEGAQLENQRIKAVKAQLIPGHEELIDRLAFDGSTSGEQAAMEIIKAEKLLRSKALDDFKDNANKAVPPAPSNEDLASGKSPEEKAKAKWDADEALRTEFAGSFDTYLAYITESDEVRVKSLKRGE